MDAPPTTPSPHSRPMTTGRPADGIGRAAPVTREVPAEAPWILEGRGAHADRVAHPSTGAAR
jgi:hypothetical protein